MSGLGAMLLALLLVSLETSLQGGGEGQAMIVDKSQQGNGKILLRRALQKLRKPPRGTKKSASLDFLVTAFVA
uniref:Conotoxin O3 superfamily protein n=2 Tax=Conus TaxID=6490 RepID=A0AA50QZH3_CONBL|nr:conotoxin precursor O3 superfamily protein [Conus araneosus]WMD30186.1 conotoxin precursor O3 superfamily protein [Conus buxeus loroisii]